MAAPIPLDAPVTTATFPLRRFMTISLISRLDRTPLELGDGCSPGSLRCLDYRRFAELLHEKFRRSAPSDGKGPHPAFGSPLRPAISPPRARRIPRPGRRVPAI